MKVSIVRGGGLLGIPTRTELDETRLPPDGADAFRTKVEAAAPLASAAAIDEAAHPDELAYVLTLEDAGSKKTAQYTETSLPQPVRSLIEWVDARPERSDELVPPGAAA